MKEISTRGHVGRCPGIHDPLLIGFAGVSWRNTPDILFVGGVFFSPAPALGALIELVVLRPAHDTGARVSVGSTVSLAGLVPLCRNAHRFDRFANGLGRLALHEEVLVLTESAASLVEIGAASLLVQVDHRDVERARM